MHIEYAKICIELLLEDCHIWGFTFLKSVLCEWVWKAKKRYCIVLYKMQDNKIRRKKICVTTAFNPGSCANAHPVIWTYNVCTSLKIKQKSYTKKLTLPHIKLSQLSWYSVSNNSTPMKCITTMYDYKKIDSEYFFKAWCLLVIYPLSIIC